MARHVTLQPRMTPLASSGAVMGAARLPMPRAETALASGVERKGDFLEVPLIGVHSKAEPWEQCYCMFSGLP